MRSTLQCLLLQSTTCSPKSLLAARKHSTHPPNPPKQAACLHSSQTLPKSISLKKVIFLKQMKTAYMLVLEKGPSSFLFIKGDWLSQKVRKKNIPALAGRCNAIYWEQSPGCPLAPNTILAVFQTRKERATPLTLKG